MRTEENYLRTSRVTEDCFFSNDDPSLSHDLTMDYDRTIEKSESTTPAVSPRSLKKAEQALAYLQENYRSSISAEQLSIEVKLSVEKLQEALKALTGRSLHKNLQQIRIEQARKLLESSSVSIKVIASKTGFKTHSHFGEVFKSLMGMTPFQYREEHGC